MDEQTNHYAENRCRFQNSLLDLMAAGADMAEMVDLFCEETSVRAVLTDDIFTPLVISGGNVTHRSTELIDVIDGEPGVVIDRQKQFQWEAKRCELRHKDILTGYLYIDRVALAECGESLIMALLPELARGIRAELTKEKALLQQKRHWKGAFLFDLLYGNVKDEASVKAYAKTWEWDLEVPHVVVSFCLNDYDMNLGDDQLLEKIERKWATYFSRQLITAMVLQKREEMVLFVPAKSVTGSGERVLRNRIQELLQAVGGLLEKRELFVGVGRPYAKGTDFYRSYQEAKMARNIGIYETGDRLSFFKDIGVLKILYSHDRTELAEFYHDIMDPLLSHDAHSEADLVLALKSYIENDLDIGKTSEAMFVHRNTIRYRLTKIEELLQVDLSDISVILNFLIAFRIESLNRVQLTKKRG